MSFKTSKFPDSDIVFNVNSLKLQNFTLPYSVISYITNFPSSPTSYFKLQKTCKYFFYKKQIVVTEKIISFSKNKIKLCELNEDGLFVEKAELPLDNFYYWPSWILGISENSHLSFKKIYCLDIELLQIKKQDLTLNEFNYLSFCKKVKLFTFIEGNIRDDNNIPVSFNYILSKFPNISAFIYDNHCETFNTKKFEVLNSVNFKQKFKYFNLYISHMEEEIDPSLLWNFMKKNMAVNRKFEISFCEPIAEGYKTKVQTSLEEELQKWERQEEKPMATVKFYD